MNNTLNLSLIEAAEHQDIERVKDIAAHEKNVDLNFNHHEAIKILAQKSQWETVKFLVASEEIKKHADIDFVEVFQQSIDQDNFEAFKWLLENCQMSNFEDVICYAIDQDKFKFFEYLLENSYCSGNLTVSHVQHEIDLVRYTAINLAPTQARPYISYLLTQYRDKQGSYYHFRFPDTFYASSDYPNDTKLHVEQCLKNRDPSIKESLIEKIHHLIEG